MADLDPTVWESAKAAILSQFVSIGDDINPYQEDYDSQTSYIKLVSSVITTPVENSSADVSCRAFIPPENFIADIDFSNRQYSRLLSVVYLCKVIIRKLMYVYLNNPLLLALLPMVFGLTLGIVIGNLWPYQAMKGCEKNPTAATDDVSSSGVRPSSKIWGKNRIRQDPSMVLLLVRRIKNLITKILQLFQEKIIATISLFLCLFLKDNKFVYYSDAYEKDQDDWEYNANDSTVNEIEEDEERDNSARIHLLSSNRSQRESGIPLSDVPQHIAVIMDGNRRYGRAKYGSATRGHWDGSKILVEFAKWCISEGVSTLTVYAFSTENWNRHPTEVKTLMGIICKYCDELRVEALQRGISIRVLSTETEKIPEDVAAGIQRMVEETKHCDKFTLNICLSYGSRGEIVNACKAISSDVKSGMIETKHINEKMLGEKLLTRGTQDPDVIIRTSGEYRLSNFLLWQSAYSEFFFLEKQWPELKKEDLLHVIKEFGRGRKRRFGK